MEISLDNFFATGDETAWPDFFNYHQIRCDTGRTALRLALEDWKYKNNNSGQVWVPEYICTSVIQTIRGLDITYVTYLDLPGSNTSINPPKPADCDLVMIVHYFGLINSAALAWLENNPQRHWYVLEDCVQSPYTKGVGTTGDYSIISLRKWWPVPDGAVLYSVSPLLISPYLAPPNEQFISQRILGKILRLSSCSDVYYLNYIYLSEALLETSPPRHVSFFSRIILSNINITHALMRRRSNWKFIHSKLNDIEKQGFTALYKELSDCEVPLTYPIRVKNGNRDRLYAWLIENNIYCPIHWKFKELAFDSLKLLAESILSLPIDQRYNENDMLRIIDVLTHFK